MAKRFQLSYVPSVAVMAVVVLLLALPSISADDNKSPEPPSSGSSDEEFFRKSCSVTPYPDVCNDMVIMVSPSKIKQNPFEMVKNAVELSMVSSHGSTILIGDMGAQVPPPGLKKGLNPPTEPQSLAEVVQGCTSQFRTVMNLKARAAKQMDQLNNPTSSSTCKAEMKDVQTWLLDAIREEGKCLASIVKKFNEAIVNINMESKVTSNALALAKDFVVNH